MENKRGLTILVVILITAFLLAAWQMATWNVMIVRPPEENKDYIGLVIQAFTADPIGLLFGEKEGSAPMLPYFGLGLVLMWAVFLVERHYRWRDLLVAGRRTSILSGTDRFFWSSLTWCLYTTIFVMVAWIFGAAAQHYQWYACFPRTIQGVVHQCYLGEQGSMDKYTHFLSAGAIAALIATVNLTDILMVEGRRGRLLEFAVWVALIVAIAFGFENIESSAPSVYVNVYLNSVTDILAGVAGGIMNLLVYNIIVPLNDT